MKIVIAAGVLGVVALAVWAAIPRRAGLGDGSVSVAAGASDPMVATRVNRCISMQREVAARRAQRGGPAPPGQLSDAAVVAQACAPLYAQAGCRDALLHFDEPPPEARTTSAFQACARAYCSILSPAPEACTKPPQAPEEQLAAWTQLRGAILRHDIGEAEAARIESALRR